MYYDNYNYIGINNFVCRLCASNGSILDQNMDQRLIRYCECETCPYSHKICQKNYIINSSYPKTYETCPVCEKKSKLPYNYNFNEKQAKRLYYMSILLKLIQISLIILSLYSSLIIFSWLVNEYIFDYVEYIECIKFFDLGFSSSIIITGSLLMILISNLISVMYVINIRNKYNREKNNVYTRMNYYLYENFLKIKQNKYYNICMIIMIVLVIIVFIYIALPIILLTIHMINEKNKLENKYYVDAYISTSVISTSVISTSVISTSV